MTRERKKHCGEARFVYCEGVVGSDDAAGYFQYRGVLQIWIIAGQGPTLLAVGMNGRC